MAETGYLSINEFTGNGVQRTYEISFAGGYISKAHVTAELLFMGTNAIPWPFSWTNDNTILTDVAPPAGYTLRVSRNTPKETPLADYSDGAVLTATSLDVNARQAVFLAAEAADQTSSSDRRAISVPVGSFLTTEGFVVVTEAGTAITQPYLDTIIRAGVLVTDFGTWGGAQTDYGVWG